MDRVEPPLIDVSLLFAAAPHLVEAEHLRLPAGATAGDACAASALWRRLAALPGTGAEAGLQLGLWGRLCGPDTRLQAGDRLELLRPLRADPMDARRQRLLRDGLRKVQRSPRKAASKR